MPVRVQHEDFDLGAEVAALRAGRAGVGAVAAFVGTVREFGGDEAVAAMELEYYPGMTEAALEEIAAQARRRWPVAEVLVVHRVGRIAAGDQIVLAAVACAHRGDAFAACAFVMDQLKARAPFWKKEFGTRGARWVTAREQDQLAAAGWDA